MHPFDGYKGQKGILFDEFRSSLPLTEMLCYLDGYPVPLPCRYADRMACYTEVYIISNIPLEKQYPNVQLETMRASYEDVERWVRTGQVDCGFCRLPVHTGLKSYFLADDPLVVITPPNHRLREKEVISYSDLDGEDFIRPTQDRFNDVASLLALSNVTLHFPHMVHDYHEVITSVASGLGISIVPAMMMKMYAFSVSVHQLEDHPHRRIGLVVRNEKNISPITKAFIEITQKLFEDGTLG